MTILENDIGYPRILPEIMCNIDELRTAFSIAFRHIYSGFVGFGWP